MRGSRSLKWLWRLAVLCQQAQTWQDFPFHLLTDYNAEDDLDEVNDYSGGLDDDSVPPEMKTEHWGAQIAGRGGRGREGGVLGPVLLGPGSAQQGN